MDYKNGKIYRLVCNVTGLQYIGSTSQSLSKRMYCHKADYKRFLMKTYHFVSSFKIIENGDYDIILIESYPCKTKEELHQRERFHIEANDCVNKNIPSRKMSEYYNDNRNELLEQKHEYYLQNKEKICQKAKLFLEANKDIINAKRREKYIIKKDQMNAHRREVARLKKQIIILDDQNV